MSPSNIILIGFMGCGKSTVGHLLATDLSYRFTDTDMLIEEKEKRTIKEIFSQEGENYFRMCENAIMSEDMGSLNHVVISTGGGLPLFVDNLSEKGFVVYLSLPFDAIVERLSSQERENRPLFHNLEEAEKLYIAREPFYKKSADFVVDATQKAEEIVEKIKKAYASRSS